MYYSSQLAMGKRIRDRQPAMWVTTVDLPTAASHPFYRRLNQLLREHGFDDFVETQCARHEATDARVEARPTKEKALNVKEGRHRDWPCGRP